MKSVQHRAGYPQVLAVRRRQWRNLLAAFSFTATAPTSLNSTPRRPRSLSWPHLQLRPAFFIPFASLSVLTAAFCFAHFLASQPVRESRPVSDGLREFPVECRNAPDLFRCLNPDD
jgi:hypothetical protein